MIPSTDSISKYQYFHRIRNRTIKHLKYAKPIIRQKKKKKNEVLPYFNITNQWYLIMN